MAELRQRPNALFGTFPLSSRQFASRSSRVAVHFFHYSKQNFGVSSNVRATKFGNPMGTREGVIQEDIASLKVSKNLRSPSGTFEIQLFPTHNWKQILGPGDWLKIHIADSEKNNFDLLDVALKGSTKNMVLLGNIDRVARSLEKDPQTDKAVQRYVISGRNFGKVFEETEIWFDPYAVQSTVADTALRKAGLDLIGNPSKRTQQLLDVFLGPGASFTSGKTSPLNQWKIPSNMASLFKERPVMAGAFFYNILKKKITSGLPGFTPRGPVSPESGSLWGMIQKAANLPVNELYLEEVRQNDGSVSPTIVLIPRPVQTPFLSSQFGGDAKARGALKGKFKSLQQLAKTNFVEIAPAEVLYENLGRDDHSRFNMVWLGTTAEFQYVLTHVSNVNKPLGIGNPMFLRESIQRHGLKTLHHTMDYCFAEAQGAGGSSVENRNVALFQGFLAQLYDQNFANHLYDAGTIDCTGVLEAELGKALIMKSADETQPSKVYYIEGYEHSWRFPSTWKTTFTVTHGQWLTNGVNIFIDQDAGDFGQQDKTLNNVYLAKTNQPKGKGGGGSGNLF